MDEMITPDRVIYSENHDPESPGTGGMYMIVIDTKATGNVCPIAVQYDLMKDDMAEIQLKVQMLAQGVLAGIQAMKPGYFGLKGVNVPISADGVTRNNRGDYIPAYLDPLPAP